MERENPEINELAQGNTYTSSLYSKTYIMLTT